MDELLVVAVDVSDVDATDREYSSVRNEESPTYWPGVSGTLEV